MKRKLTKLKIGELSAVDRPASRAATMVLMKREDDDTMNKRQVLTSPELGHQHLVNDNEDLQSGSTSWDRAEGEQDGHSHSWVRDKAGKITIALSNGHTHSVGVAGLRPTPTSATKGGADHLAKALAKRTELHDALETAARGLAKASGRTFEQSYAELLKTDAGREALEADYFASADLERGPQSAAPALKADVAAIMVKASSIEDRIDEMAKAIAARTGGTVAAAYDTALSSPEGRVLYAQVCALREQA